MKVWPGIHQSAQEIKIEAFSIETDSPVCKAFSFVALASKNILKKKKAKQNQNKNKKHMHTLKLPGIASYFIMNILNYSYKQRPQCSLFCRINPHVNNFVANFVTSNWTAQVGYNNDNNIIMLPGQGSPNLCLY